MGAKETLTTCLSAWTGILNGPTMRVHALVSALANRFGWRTAMPELVHLQFGAKPWEPSETSRVIAVYDKHDRPTGGLIEQQGHTFLFDCIEGHAWDINVWAYAEVTEDQIAELTAAQGAEFAATVDRTLKGVPLVAALAVGDRLE